MTTFEDYIRRHAADGTMQHTIHVIEVTPGVFGVTIQVTPHGRPCRDRNRFDYMVRCDGLIAPPAPTPSDR